MNRFLSLIFFIAILVIGWTAAWYFAAKKINDEARSFFANSQNMQQKYDCADLDIVGFPFRFDVTCTDFTASEFDLHISLPEIKLTVLVYRPTHLLAFFKGPLSFEDNFSGSRREVSWDNLSASVRTNGWALARFSAQADNLQLVDNLIGKTLIARAQKVELHLLEDEQNIPQDETLMQVIALTKIENAAAPEFEIANAQLSFEALLNSMPNDLRQWTPASIARNWFQTQTGVQVNAFTGKDEKSEFAINGQFTTTAQAMLSGNFDFFSTGLAPRFEPFLEPIAQQIVFGNKSENGAHYQSYSLVHGVLLAGNLPILTFGPMR